MPFQIVVVNEGGAFVRTRSVTGPPDLQLVSLAVPYPDAFVAVNSSDGGVAMPSMRGVAGGRRESRARSRSHPRPHCRTAAASGRTSHRQHAKRRLVAGQRQREAAVAGIGAAQRQLRVRVGAGERHDAALPAQARPTRFGICGVLAAAGPRSFPPVGTDSRPAPPSSCSLWSPSAPAAPTRASRCRDSPSRCRRTAPPSPASELRFGRVRDARRCRTRRGAEHPRRRPALPHPADTAHGGMSSAM